MSLREKLLATKNNLTRVQVDLPGFTHPVFVREMTGRERHEYQLTIESSRDQNNMDIPSFYPLMFKLIQLVTEDEDRIKVFKESDLDAIQDMPSYIVEKLYTEASRISGLLKKESPDDADEGDLEELTDDEDDAPKNEIGAAGEIS